jgi:hypothetical protein
LGLRDVRKFGEKFTKFGEIIWRYGRRGKILWLSLVNPGHEVQDSSGEVEQGTIPRPRFAFSSSLHVLNFAFPGADLRVVGVELAGRPLFRRLNTFLPLPTGLGAGTEGSASEALFPPLQEPINPSDRFTNGVGDFALGRLEIFSRNSERLGGIVKGLIPGRDCIFGSAEQFGLRRRVPRD